MAAITLATVLMYDLTHKWFLWIIILYFNVITSVIIVLVARQTIIHMNKKEICIME
jgi:tellurite resistance protein